MTRTYAKLSVPEKDLAKVNRFCDEMNEALGEHRFYSLAKGKSITIWQFLPPTPKYIGDPVINPFPDDMRVAVMRFGPSGGRWTLFWLNRNDRPLPYTTEPQLYSNPVLHIETLLKKIEEDRYGCFFG